MSDRVSENFPQIFEQLLQLRNESKQRLSEQGFQETQIECTYFLHMRYEKTDTAIMVACSITDKDSLSQFEQVFQEKYRREFGFVLTDRNIIIDDLRVRSRGKSECFNQKDIPSNESGASPEPSSKTLVYFEKEFMETSVYLLENMLAGDKFSGPALLIDKNSTVVVEPNSSVEITRHGNIEISIGRNCQKDLTTKASAIKHFRLQWLL